MILLTIPSGNLIGSFAIVIFFMLLNLAARKAYNNYTRKQEQRNYDEYLKTRKHH